MGYALAMGRCFACGTVFGFNPVRVPSIRSPATGQKEPICRACIERANPMRIKNGLPPIEIQPDAYEACDEQELG